MDQGTLFMVKPCFSYLPPIQTNTILPLFTQSISSHFCGHVLLGSYGSLQQVASSRHSQTPRRHHKEITLVFLKAYEDFLSFLENVYFTLEQNVYQSPGFGVLSILLGLLCLQYSSDLIVLQIIAHLVVLLWDLFGANTTHTKSIQMTKTYCNQVATD